MKGQAALRRVSAGVDLRRKRRRAIAEKLAE
jgi:hypothetical protein